MKKTAVALVTTLVVAACGASVPAGTTTAPVGEQLPPVDAVAVTITSAEIGPGEVTITGEKPSPCHELGSIVYPADDTIDIEVWAVQSDTETCAQVIEPFEISFELQTPDSETPIIVNGEEVGRVGA